MSAQQTWIDRQPGAVTGFEKVRHVFLSEDSGEMFCAVCNGKQISLPNRGMRFAEHIRQMDAFEKFTESHVHEVIL